LSLSLQYVEILHLIRILKQTLVCISPVLAFSSVAYLTKIHCSQKFEALHLEYGFLSIILVLENFKFMSLKVLEKSLNFVL